MARSRLFVEIVKKLFPRDPRAAKLTKLPGVARMVEKRFFEGDNLICLPRDNVIPVNKEIADQGSTVLPSQVVDHFIQKSKCLWIMNFCICREAMQCKDYPIGLGCLFMGEAVLGINPKMGRRVTKDEAREFVRKCREAGLVHMMGKSKLDTWWLGIGPGEKLFTVCSCCPCCCITRGLPYSEARLNAKLHRMPGVSVTVTEECTGCDDCTKKEVCFTNAISLEGGRAVISEQCRACGRCISVCSQKAIKLKIDNPDFVNMTISEFREIVDVT
jgi:ferredoxin